MDFPDNALTNFYVLHDFTDIAYAVYVVTDLATDVVKGTSPPKLSHAQAPSTARLRKAEREIRRIGILVSSDTAKHELFTFFRKTDLQRDGKSIFSRLIAVLRSNVCTISEKKAARASDMLHPDNSRLYRLFILALTPSIRSIIANFKGLIPSGMARFIVQSPKIDTPDGWCIEPNDEKTYRLLDMNTQLVASGHLLISFRQCKSAHLWHPTLREQSPKIKSPAQGEGSDGKLNRMLVVAPSGRLARYIHRHASSVADSQDRQPPNMGNYIVQGTFGFESTKREIWETMVKDWLADQEIELQASDQKEWLDIELPVRIVGQSPVSSGSPAATQFETLITWLSFSWPLSLCFELRETEPHAAIVLSEELESEDPLSFAEDWFLGAEARAKILEERKLSRLAKEELGDQLIDPETVPQNPLTASSPTFHRHAVRELSLSHNIYPTPPDGPVSQVTPGMSSIDGVVATPTEQNPQLPEASHKLDDEEMDDVADPDEGDLTIGTGQYDEDLFGDIPVETFGPSGIADEPNWDFFDEPDLDMATGDSEPAETRDMEHNDALNVGESEVFVAAPNDRAVSNPSPIVEDREEIERQGRKVEEVQINLVQNPDLDSPKSETNHLLGKDHKGNTVESVITVQRHHPLSTSEIKHVVADTLLFSRQFPRDAAEHTASSDREIYVQSTVDIVHAESGAQLSDDKYSANGRFWFGNENGNTRKAPQLTTSIVIPSIALHSFGSGSQIAQEKVDDPNKMVLDTMESETPSSTEESDFDSIEFFSNAHEPVHSSENANREWIKYAPISPEHPKTDRDQLDEQKVRLEFDQLLEHLMIDDFQATQPVYEWQKPESRTVSTKSANDITIAQILVDQLTQSSLQHNVFSMPEGEDASPLDYDISKDLSDVYGTAEQVNLHELARISCPENDDAERISKLNDTTISLYREGKPLTALATILPFWDALGLQPASGRKNVTALCVHPHGSNVNDGCRAFIERLRETYENCNLGTHIIGKLAGTTNDGLVAWSYKDASLPDLFQTCERVGTALSRLPATDDNIMIYMILPNESESQFLMNCEGFMALWSNYVNTCGKKQPNELALQLIPLSFVALPDTLAIPSQYEYTTLAIEVYNRCPPANVGEKIAHCGSAIVLAEHVNKHLDFDLTSTVQSPFEKTGRALHLAYSQSKDNRWITAAWTDKLGTIALTMSYCLRQRGSRNSRPVAEIIKELWDISVDLMQKSRTKWMLIIAREGRVAPTEVNDWVVLANQDVVSGQNHQHILVLLSVNTEPSLSLRLLPSTIKQVQVSAAQQPSGLYGTPVSTPQASTTSPDYTTMTTPTPGGTALNAPTPPDHTFDPNAETDLILSDPVEATWSVVLSHGISQSDSILEARPALASGYLLKRRGTTDADNVVGLEVNCVHVAVTLPSERQNLLKEILSQYKDLVTLTKTRGMVDPTNSVLPWHIATAMKGQQALSLIM